MKIKIAKTDNGIVAKIINNGKENEFSNLEMIDFLYNTNEDIEFDYDSVTDEEQKKITDLYNKIKAKIESAKKADTLNENNIT